ncbi:MAG: AMP-binding protein, partial [Solirubrobacteraceae bacterium]
KLGASVLYLNTAFAGPQIADVLHREAPSALIYDAEFADLVSGGADGLRRFVAWCDPGEDRGDPRLEELIARGDSRALSPPEEKGRVVILTSGTTGAPKGANRKQPDSMEPAAALFSKIPLRARETTVIAAPMFHSWGYAHFTLGLALSSTLVLPRRFDPEETLRAIARHRASALAVVPVMLQRILELPRATIECYDLSSLRVIALSGSALPGELATKAMDVLGDVLYNLYGSTEVAWATIATPADLRAAPGTAGRPPMGTVVKLLDPEGHEVAPGEGGRIFVANEMVFEGYTGGGNKEIVSGLMSTGDVGHIDAAGRLFVDGRDDEMIVSGGENVFPREVEDLLADHPGVEEAAVIGVPDEEFGQRLKAFVVPHSGVDLGEDAVKSYVKENLARYKVPREVVFLGELPRNATGKVLKRELQES